MRSPLKGRAAWPLALVLAWSSLPVARSASPVAPTGPSPGREATESASSTASDQEAALQHGLDLERKRNWPAAVRAYEEALSQWPSRAEFGQRRRLCETHYKLVRRYQDQSFRNVLLRLPREKAMELYDELLERIETHYVDLVPFEPLVRRGLDNLEVALRDPDFLRLNARDASPQRVTWLRDRLGRRRERLSTPDRVAAQSEVLAAADLASQALGLAPAALILEFTYGACDALDDYTNYLTPDKLDDLYAMIDGNFVGLGIELKLDTEGLRLVGVMRKGPAWDAGLKVGDQITRVAGKAVRGLSLDEAAGLLQGAEGTAVDLTVVQPGGTRAFRIVRRHVEVDSVAQAKLVSNGIGYIQLTGFQKNSTDELDKAITALRRQGMRSLVLDLRGNPGGLLNVAVEIAERFIDQGIIVSTRGRAPGQSQVYRAQSRALWTMPLTVLIDHDSASASEILAGALKDHNRAVLLGQRSYGKGSVQSIFTLRSAPAGLKLTTAKFYSPKNRPYSEQGVEPDVPYHVAARPKFGDDPSATPDDLSNSPEVFGDPLRDAVLDHAIQQAKRRLNASR